jgi:hypothetical protein
MKTLIISILVLLALSLTLDAGKSVGCYIGDTLHLVEQDKRMDAQEWQQ